MTAKKSNKKRTYRQRTFELETVKFAMARGYASCAGNESAIRHFNFVYTGAGSPDIEVSWYQGSNAACITVGRTTMIGSADTEAADRRALEQLKKFW